MLDPPLAPPRHLTRRLIITAAVLAVALGGYIFALSQIASYETGITRQDFTISNTIPLIRFMPASSKGNTVAILVPGYFGDKEVMTGIGVELARMGVPSYLMDLPSHGESPVPLDTSDPLPQLESALNTVVTYVQHQQQFTSPANIVLIGHSFGSEVVWEYMKNSPYTHEHPITLGTPSLEPILLSPVLQTMPKAAYEIPGAFTVIVGSVDLPQSVAAAHAIFTASCNFHYIYPLPNNFICLNPPPLNTSPLVGIGDTVYTVEGATHISILTDARALHIVTSTVAHIGGITNVPAIDNTRLIWMLLGLAGGIGAVFPLIAFAATLGLANGGVGIKTISEPLTATRKKIMPWEALGIAASCMALAVLLLRLWSFVADALGFASLRTPMTWVHMALADYIASFALATALFLVAYFVRQKQTIPWPSRINLWQQIALGSIAPVVFFVLLGVLSNMSWERFVLDGPRALRFVALLAAVLPLFLLLEGIMERMQARVRTEVLVRLGMFAAICLSLVLAIVLDSSLFFLSILLPIQALLFVIFAAITVWMSMQAQHSRWAAAISMAAIFAWAIAAIFPITT